MPSRSRARVHGAFQQARGSQPDRWVLSWHAPFPRRRSTSALRTKVSKPRGVPDERQIPKIQDDEKRSPDKIDWRSIRASPRDLLTAPILQPEPADTNEFPCIMRHNFEPAP